LGVLRGSIERKTDISYPFWIQFEGSRFQCPQPACERGVF
jgi:hypothetical protein